MIIDDDVRNLFAVANLLDAHGAEIVTAENAQQGLDMLHKDPSIDLVLMDVMLPGMDGYQATEAIRKTPGLEAIPVIALTAKAMPEDRQRCIESGCSDFVPKPVDNDKLLTTIKKWVEREKRQP